MAQIHRRGLVMVRFCHEDASHLKLHIQRKSYIGTYLKLIPNRVRNKPMWQRRFSLAHDKNPKENYSPLSTQE